MDESEKAPGDRRMRKNMKEKERRARVNQVYDELASMVHAPRKNKSEKVPVLEAAIKEIKSLRAQLMAHNITPNPCWLQERQNPKSEPIASSRRQQEPSPCDPMYMASDAAPIATGSTPVAERSSFGDSSSPERSPFVPLRRTVRAESYSMPTTDGCGQGACGPILHNTLPAPQPLFPSAHRTSVLPSPQGPTAATGDAMMEELSHEMQSRAALTGPTASSTAAAFVSSDSAVKREDPMSSNWSIGSFSGFDGLGSLNAMSSGLSVCSNSMADLTPGDLINDDGLDALDERPPMMDLSDSVMGLQVGQAHSHSHSHGQSLSSNSIMDAVAASNDMLHHPSVIRPTSSSPNRLGAASRNSTSPRLAAQSQTNRPGATQAWTYTVSSPVESTYGSTRPPSQQCRSSGLGAFHRPDKTAHSSTSMSSGSPQRQGCTSSGTYRDASSMSIAMEGSAADAKPSIPAHFACAAPAPGTVPAPAPCPAPTSAQSATVSTLSVSRKPRNQDSGMNSRLTPAGKRTTTPFSARASSVSSFFNLPSAPGNASPATSVLSFTSSICGFTQLMGPEPEPEMPPPTAGDIAPFAVA